MAWAAKELPSGAYGDTDNFGAQKNRGTPKPLCTGEKERIALLSPAVSHTISIKPKSGKLMCRIISRHATIEETFFHAWHNYKYQDLKGWPFTGVQGWESFFARNISFIIDPKKDFRPNQILTQDFLHKQLEN